jgi:cell shape-determining protein MreC
MPRGPLTPARLLTATTIALVLLALAPASLTRWTGALRDPVVFILAPIAQPLTRLSRLVRPPGRQADSEVVRSLESERDHWQSEAFRAQARVDALESLVKDLQGGVGVAPGLDLKQIAAPVIASSSDLRDGALVVRAGLDRGVIALASVAATRGVHLVGRVVDVRARSCTVLPVTSRSAGLIDAVVHTADGLGPRACQLRASGDGRLRGDMVSDATGVEVGQVVSVRDQTWPGAAQGLILGRIAEVERRPTQRLAIVVQPEVPPERVGEVILRVPADADAPEEPAP